MGRHDLSLQTSNLPPFHFPLPPQKNPLFSFPISLIILFSRQDNDLDLGEGGKKKGKQLFLINPTPMQPKAMRYFCLFTLAGKTLLSFKKLRG
jgi:hypothetical protein